EDVPGDLREELGSYRLQGELLGVLADELVGPEAVEHLAIGVRVEDRAREVGDGHRRLDPVEQVGLERDELTARLAAPSGHGASKASVPAPVILAGRHNRCDAAGNSLEAPGIPTALSFGHDTGRVAPGAVGDADPRDRDG